MGAEKRPTLVENDCDMHVLVGIHPVTRRLLSVMLVPAFLSARWAGTTGRDGGQNSQDAGQGSYQVTSV